MYCLLEEQYHSGVGPLTLRLEASTGLATTTWQEAERTVLTPGHEISIRHLPSAGQWLPGGASVTAVAAWAFYIRKRNAQEEQLVFSIGLTNPCPAIETSPDNGQWLTAIELATAAWQVHIGTQDEDYLGGRAATDAWVPQRLAADLSGYRLLVTDIEATGLRTRVPPLLAHEQFYFHYIVAESPRRKAVDYPDEWDIGTWLAVEQERKPVEKAWQHFRASA